MGEIVDIILYNNDPGEHPMHVHGHHFWVLGMGQPDEGPYQDQPLDLVAPVVRDTASVNANSWLVIRLQMNNPGVWAYHCHIDWHLENGLLLVIVVAPEAIRARLGSTSSLVTCPVA
uniref:Plastocyanin-like domain-containing protein n=1 Tax=Arcella intermedia TaxID=1963864 RepID=A0A6B2LS28_9EUKA